jgi:hypothetical protein
MDDELTIYLRNTVNCILKKVSLTRKCHPANWNISAGRAIGKREGTKALISAKKASLYDTPRTK